MENKFFAAANTQNGFESFFDEIFFNPKISRRYIIKGGPGTGKSSLMKKLGAKAEQAGHSVEWYFCSSDTSSLDGVLIDGTVAIFDGTAPHSYDTVLPGAVDKIINLGEYWNDELLVSHKGEIAALASKKSKAYADAYGYLRAAGELSSTIDSVVLPCVNCEKLLSAARRLVPHAAHKTQGGRQIRQVSALGVRGEVSFDTLKKSASQHVFIEDYYGTAHLLLKEICDASLAGGFDVQVSFAVPNMNKYSEIYLPKADLYFVISDGMESRENAKSVNMKRFTDAQRLADIRFTLRTAMRTYEKLCDLAADSLRMAGVHHAAMEKYYILAMDFERLETDMRALRIY